MSGDLGLVEVRADSVSLPGQRLQITVFGECQGVVENGDRTRERVAELLGETGRDEGRGLRVAEKAGRVPCGQL